MTIHDMVFMPQVHEKTHESIYRSYHILEYIMGMVERGDSPQTIKDVHSFLMRCPKQKEEIWFEDKKI